MSISQHSLLVSALGRCEIHSFS